MMHDVEVSWQLFQVPQDPSTLRQNIYYCASCNQYKPSVEFQLSTNSRTVGRCRPCRNLDNDARTRQDYSHYRLMLKELRRLEESYGDDSKVAFLLQVSPLQTFNKGYRGLITYFVDQICRIPLNRLMQS